MTQALPSGAPEILADLAAGRLENARRTLRALVAREPALPWPWQLLAATCWQAEPLRAEIMLRRTLVLSPGDLSALTALVATMEKGGRASEAGRELRQIVALSPNDDACMATLANVVSSPTVWVLRALGVRPESDDLALLAITRLLAIGDAAAAARIGAGRLSSSPQILASQICTSFLLEEAHPHTSLRLARHFNERFARPLTSNGPLRQRFRTGSGKVRIGYVAGRSFGLHTTAFTLSPTIEGHDRGAAEVFCYSDLPVSSRDEITERFAAASSGFRDVSGLSDEAVARAIAEDRIDAVIDCLGYPQGSRLLALARRPAPLQIHWPLMGSLGLDAVDVVLGDRWITPEGAERWFSETLVRLPLAYVYDPLRPLSDIGPAPSRDVVFGSFNQLAKLSRRTVRLWSRILRGFPRSRLLLKTPGLADTEARSRVKTLFAEEGTDPGRIELRPPTRNFEEHMASYADIDIALDPTPYGGVITTLEAMWMGVPVVTLAGDRVLGRYGHAFVSALGLSQLSAADEDDYVAKALALAENETGRAVLRTSLRERMRASPICDGRAMAASIEAAIRGLLRS